MSINKFGSFSEYLRQTYELSPRPELKASADTWVGIALVLLSVLCLTLAIAGSDDEVRGGFRFAGYFIWAATLLYHVVPLFHAEYGLGKKGNRE